jgi:hypothetical protein
MVAHPANCRLRRRTISTALSVVEDEINYILGPACAIAEPGHGRARAESPMKPQLALGDRVKLNERGMRLGAQRSWTKIDWPNRRGTVRHITKHSEAHVQWDGRKSVDVLPVVTLERCRSPSPP